MKMPTMQLRLITMRTMKTKNDKDITFVKLADEKTFDSIETILGNETNVGSLEVQKRYDAVISVDGKYTSVDLYPTATSSK